MSNKLITNVGYVQGYLGKGVVYVCKTSDGKIFLAVPVKVGEETKFQYLTKDRFENFLIDPASAVQSDFNRSLISNEASPSFTGASWDGFPSVEFDNVTSVPRLWDGQSAYTIKGNGITDTDITAIKNTASTATGTTNTVGAKFLPTTSEEWGLLASNPLQFVTTYWTVLLTGLLFYIFFTKSGKKLGRKLGLVSKRR